MRLYKFLSKEFALKSMRERRCKISRLSQMNDPFEMFPFDLTHIVARVALTTTLETMDLIAGAMCFSKEWSNPVIWAHYADQHRGICLGFDVPDENVQAITYTGQREPFPDFNALSADEALAAMNRILFTKFADWAYEKEYRVPVKLDWSTITENGLLFVEWGDNFKLAEVIVGLRSPTCKRELERALDGYRESVTFARAAASHDAFSVVQDDRELRGCDELVFYRMIGQTYHPLAFVRDI